MPLTNRQIRAYLRSPRAWGWIGIFLLVGALGIHLRLMPLLTFASDDAMEKASLLVVSHLRQKVTAKIERERPGLPSANREELVQNQVNELLHKNPDRVRRTIANLAQNLDREMDAETRTPYLLASDSFYYLGQTERIIEQGAVSAKIKGSKYLNELMLAPEGHWEPLNLHPYLGAWLYRLWRFFDRDVDLMHAVAFLPLLILALSLACFLVVCRLLNADLFSALCGSVFFVTAPILFKRSCYGWYDNDPYNAFFPLVILAVLFYGLKHRRHLKKLILAACISVFGFGLYALFWHGWMFLLAILFGAGLLMVGHAFFFRREKQTSLNLLIFHLMLPAAALLGITLVFGLKEFFILIAEGWRAVNDFFKPQLSVWPDLYIGVGELHGASLATIIDLTGGWPAWTLAGLGLAAYLIPMIRRRHPDNLYPFVFLMVFLISSVLLSFGAERFTLLVLTPITLLITLGLDALSRQIMELRREWITDRSRTMFLTGILALMIVLLLTLPIRTAYLQWPQRINRIYNDTWHSVLTRVRATTPADSIINTWWSPGHFIKAMARRRVTFDGASINKPQAYWMARVLMSTDEREALGLLRRLNNSGNQATVLLQDSGLTLADAVTLLETIAPLPLSQASRFLDEHTQLTSTQKERLRDMIFRRPPPSYLLIYNELVEKNIQLSFVSRWDFSRIEAMARDPEARRELLAGPRQYASKVWKMQGGQPKFSGIMKASYQTAHEVRFKDEILIDLDRLTCRIESPKFGRGIPYSLFFADGPTVREKKFKEFNLPYSAVLYRRKDRYHAALMDHALARSLLMRLFFFNGQGMRYITPVMQGTDLTLRTEIYVFKIEWEKFLEESGR